MFELYDHEFLDEDDAELAAKKASLKQADSADGSQLLLPEERKFGQVREISYFEDFDEIIEEPDFVTIKTLTPSSQ